MKMLRILSCFLMFSLLLASCGSDDSSEGDMNNFFFEATIDGESYRTETITGSSFFSLYFIVVGYDNTDEEFQFQLSGVEEGTYEVSGSGGKSLGGSWGVHEPSSGSLVVTSYNDETKIIEGTVNVTFRSFLPGAENRVITNGRFRAKFPF